MQPVLGLLDEEEIHRIEVLEDREGQPVQHALAHLFGGDCGSAGQGQTESFFPSIHIVEAKRMYGRKELFEASLESDEGIAISTQECIVESSQTGTTLARKPHLSATQDQRACKTQDVGIESKKEPTWRCPRHTGWASPGTRQPQ